MSCVLVLIIEQSRESPKDLLVLMLPLPTLDSQMVCISHQVVHNLVLDTTLEQSSVPTDGSALVRLLVVRHLQKGSLPHMRLSLVFLLIVKAKLKVFLLETPSQDSRGSQLLPSTSKFDIVGSVAVGSTQSGQAGKTSGFIRWRYADSFQTILPDSSDTAVAAGCSFDLVNIAVIDEDGFFYRN